MSQPPRKRAKRVPDDIERANYTTSRTSRKGVRIVERSTQVLDIAGPSIGDGRGTLYDDGGNVEDVADMAGFQDPDHHFIPRLEDIRSQRGKVGPYIRADSLWLIDRRTKMIFCRNFSPDGRYT